MSYSSVYTHVPGAIVAWISGLIVRCWTFSSIRMTTSPPRWIIPKIGGFSVASVPRPRLPLSRLRRPHRPFFSPSPAGLCAQPRYRPRHIQPRRLRWVPTSSRRYLGVTDTSFDAHQRDGDRVLGQFAGLTG